MIPTPSLVTSSVQIPKTPLQTERGAEFYLVQGLDQIVFFPSHSDRFSQPKPTSVLGASQNLCSHTFPAPLTYGSWRWRSRWSRWDPATPSSCRSAARWRPASSGAGAYCQRKGWAGIGGLHPPTAPQGSLHPTQGSLKHPQGTYSPFRGHYSLLRGP